MDATPDEETPRTEAIAKKKNKTVTEISVNGRSATAQLIDSQGTNGFLTATEDQIAHTYGLDFSWATPDPNNSLIAVLYQGAGQIPAGKFTFVGGNARLNLTTPSTYTVTRCEVNLDDGTSECAPTSALTFNMTWTINGFGSVHEKTKRKEVMGPVTTKVNAEFTILTANVNGTWAGHSTPNMGGDITDSESETYIREITVAP